MAKLKSGTIQEKIANACKLLELDTKLTIESFMKYYMQSGECRYFEVAREMIYDVVEELKEEL